LQNLLVMLCGLRPSVLGQDWSKTKKIGLGLGLAGLVLCCQTRLVTLIVIMILKDRETFQVLFIVSLFCGWKFGTSLLWRSTVAFTYLKVKSTNCLCLLPILVLLIYGHFGPRTFWPRDDSVPI